ncbi:queuosine salvage family protein [uncultured Tateyamaria sp.]|uniref:queuosine salvage family protein n=1 Tax=uncultured Tateyamaria sp. TaxID=455651 RepID=UPI00260528B8|nr:queuosine salvage family protein [uncultured Tateyamaria sp.]
MSISIFDKIRNSTRHVAENARWVHVDEMAINAYPESLLLSEKIVLDHTPEHHLLDQGEDTMRFFVILDSINFGSGYFPFLDKDKGVSGYFTVARRLKSFCEREGIPSSGELAQLDKKKCAAIFEQEIDSPHMDELMQLFSLALRELGSWATENFDGDILGFLRKVESAEAAILSLMNMNSFRDVAYYHGFEVPLLKRAQIMLQDIKLALPNHHLIQFHDMDDLTIFADNILPFVFSCDGLIKYHPWIEERISNEEIIGSGSSEEIEMRACSVYVAERVGEIINEELKPMSVRELDYVLWNRGQKLKKSTTSKRHRTRCIFY